MKSITQDYIIQASIGEVYKALTDGPTAEQWGAAPAKVDARESGEYSYWGGDIHGVFTKLVSQKLIEQNWYGHDNPTWKYTVSFAFEGDDTSTTVHMTFSGDIQNEQKDLADWRDYYFDPIKKLLEKQ
jgi:activator of HSP90 ATPase